MGEMGMTVRATVCRWSARQGKHDYIDMGGYVHNREGS